MEMNSVQKHVSHVEGSTLSCHELNYGVQVRGACCKPAQRKRILNDINALFTPGMNAIMGPTGSGKSSLLDALAGRKDPNCLTGQLLVDGQKQPKNFKCLTGYVVQDDIVMGTLTIRENFMFSANLRLDKSVSAEEKSMRVEETIQELGLSDVSESKVGTEFIRGVSGGERKRTNIGMELIISPSVLFLDEPTSGLDSSTANSVMLLLYQLARKGRTVVFSIHQPRFAIFKLFDRLLLLAQGYNIYHGCADGALDFFSTVGYECEAHNNPADFFLDVINGDLTSECRKINSISGHESSTSSIVPDTTDVDIEIVAKGTDEVATLACRLNDQYTKSKWNTEVNGDLEQVLKSYKSHNSDNEPINTKHASYSYATSFCKQFGYIAQRTVRNLARNPQTSIMQLIVMIIFGLIVGIIFFDLERSLKFGIQNRAGVFFFVIQNMVFGNMTAAELFIKERVMFIHETAGGYYRVSTYFLSKIFCDVIPMRVIPTSLLTIIVYFMVGLEVDAGKFFMFFLTLVCTGLAASSLGFVISATVNAHAIANLAVVLINIFMMVFGGLFINIESIAVWLRWIQYISIFRYGLNALSVNEMKDMSFCNSIDVNGTTIENCDVNAGNDYLARQGIPYETAWDFWQNIVILLSMAVILQILTYVQLRRINTMK